MGRKAIVIFCALALALSWGIQFALLATVGMESDKAPFFLLANMWSPTLLALGFIAVHKPARQGVLWGPCWRSASSSSTDPLARTWR